MPAEPVGRDCDRSAASSDRERGVPGLPDLSQARLTTLADVLSAPDGKFTVNPVTGAAIDAGFAVSVHLDHGRTFDRPVTGADLAAYVAAVERILALPDRAVGGWCDPEFGHVHLEVPVVVASLADAIEQGRMAGQLTVFDLSTGRAVPIPDAVVIPLQRPVGISGENQLETVTDDAVWRYHQKCRGRDDREYSGYVTFVGGAEGERMRRELSIVIADLLLWATSRHDSPDDLRDEEEAA